MIIRVDTTKGSVRLDNPMDFTSFSVHPDPPAPVAAVAAALATPVPDLEGHVWVTISQLRQLAAPPPLAWEEGFEAMIAYAGDCPLVG